MGCTQIFLRNEEDRRFSGQGEKENHRVKRRKKEITEFF
jgi:hypothetical protein